MLISYTIPQQVGNPKPFCQSTVQPCRNLLQQQRRATALKKHRQVLSLPYRHSSVEADELWHSTKWVCSRARITGTVVEQPRQMTGGQHLTFPTVPQLGFLLPEQFTSLCLSSFAGIHNEVYSTGQKAVQQVTSKN